MNYESILATTITIVSDTLSLDSDSIELDEATPLMGAIPEFDSMAVVAVLTEMEDEFGIEVEDDDISAEVFETIGSLAAFVDAKVNQAA